MTCWAVLLVEPLTRCLAKQVQRAANNVEASSKDKTKLGPGADEHCKSVASGELNQENKVCEPESHWHFLIFWNNKIEAEFPTSQPEYPILPLYFMNHDAGFVVNENEFSRLTIEIVNRSFPKNRQEICSDIFDFVFAY